MKAAAISKTGDGTETVVAVFEADTKEGIENLSNRWLDCSGRLADIPDTWGVKEAEAAHAKGEI